MIDTLTISGGLVRDAELTYTPNGAAVTGFTIAQSDSRKNEQGDWETTRNLYLDVTMWNENPQYKQNPIPWAEIAGRLQKGDKVAVRGKLHTRQWEKDGQKRTVVEMDVDEIGASLAYATVKVNRTARGSDSGRSISGQAQSESDPWGAAPSTDTPPPF